MSQQDAAINSAIAEKVKLFFDVNFDLSDIWFTYMNIKPYITDNEREFGEKHCMLTKMEFEIYGILFTVKILHFLLNKSYNVLKLDIAVFCSSIKNEIDYCCNYLQRRRNINLLFISLNKFAERVDNRRLIVENIISRNPRTKVKSLPDGGISVSYENSSLNMIFGVGWKVQWNPDHSIHDITEIYHKDIDLPNAQEITEYLVLISHPNLSYKEKAEVWNNLFKSIERNSSKIDNLNTSSVTITEIDTSDDECIISSSTSPAAPGGSSTSLSRYQNKRSFGYQNQRLSNRPSSSFNSRSCSSVYRSGFFDTETSASSDTCSIGNRFSNTDKKVPCSCCISVKRSRGTDSSTFFDSCKNDDKVNTIIGHHGSKVNPICSKANTNCTSVEKNTDVVISEADSAILLSDEDDTDVSIIETNDMNINEASSGIKRKCDDNFCKGKMINLETNSVSSSSSCDAVVVLD